MTIYDIFKKKLHFRTFCWEFLWRGLEIEHSYNKEKFTYKIALSSRHVLSHRILTQEEGRKGRSPRPKPFCYSTHSHYIIDARLGNALNRAPISTLPLTRGSIHLFIYNVHVCCLRIYFLRPSWFSRLE